MKVFVPVLVIAFFVGLMWISKTLVEVFDGWPTIIALPVIALVLVAILKLVGFRE